MVYRCNWRPDDRAVAVLADVSGLHVRRTLACGVAAIVATRTIVNDVGMVEGRRCPCNGRMAVVAVVAATDMRRVLAGRCHAVKTGTAGTEDLGVVDGVNR